MQLQQQYHTINHTINHQQGHSSPKDNRNKHCILNPRETSYNFLGSNLTMLLVIQLNCRLNMEREQEQLYQNNDILFCFKLLQHGTFCDCYGFKKFPHLYN
jgi:hypothetical protein